MDRRWLDLTAEGISFVLRAQEEMPSDDFRLHVQGAFVAIRPLCTEEEWEYCLEQCSPFLFALHKGEKA